MLEPLEAKVPTRAIRLESVAPAPQPASETRFAPIAAFFAAPVFSRLGDIMASNVGAMLDRAEDPARMVRMIILEMEETLVEVRASAARSIADAKELRQSLRRLDAVQAGWTEKAELALSRDREDLARAALVERAKTAEVAVSLGGELSAVEESLKAYEADIARLQAKLREARRRQHAIATRMESALTRAKAREVLHGSRTEDAFSRFELLEREADFAEARAEALALAGPASLEEEISAQRAASAVDAELDAMKAALAGRLN
ncbi:PspA/IM30 family protein [Sphingomonas sp. GCM10030256]|uniref:PspA/IM30 family protein n=1 Tax=Sphingomonas sp. GCM10030256 TaxID=3273427 RepID=UPI00361A4711